MQFSIYFHQHDPIQQPLGCRAVRFSHLLTNFLLPFSDPPPPGANALMPFLTPELIRKYTSAATFEEAYAHSIESPTSSEIFISLENRTLRYKVRSSGISAAVQLRAIGGIERATCECRGGGPLWCRHIVSALLIVLYKAETIVRMDAIDKAMDIADKAVLKDLLVQHCESHPEFAVLLTRSLKGSCLYFATSFWAVHAHTLFLHSQTRFPTFSSFKTI